MLRSAIIILLASHSFAHRLVSSPLDMERPLENTIDVGNRPMTLVNSMGEGALKTKLKSCAQGPFRSTSFVFGHRGAPMHNPEHTIESYKAAAQQGAGIIECDVTFTKDKQLVCRHSQCDLHTTTNILQTNLAAKCKRRTSCCTSDITLAEFKTLCGKMDPGKAANVRNDFVSPAGAAGEAAGAQRGAKCAATVSHADYIRLVNSYGLNFTPEAKTPSVMMPFEGYTQARFLQSIFADYKAAGISPLRVYFQSYNLNDITWVMRNEPAFARQAIYLVNAAQVATVSPKSLANRGVRIIGPPLQSLLSGTGRALAPSAFARSIKGAGLGIVPFSFERSQYMGKLGGAGNTYNMLDVLARQVGVRSMFADWPATVVYYANCFNL